MKGDLEKIRGRKKTKPRGFRIANTEKRRRKEREPERWGRERPKLTKTSFYWSHPHGKEIL